MNIAKQKILDILKMLNIYAKEYKKKLVGKSFLLIYFDSSKSQYCEQEIYFNANQFQHLTGVKWLDESLSARTFFDNCVDYVITEEQIVIDKNVTLKMDIMQQALNFYNTAKMYGSFNCARESLCCDTMLGTVNWSLGLEKSTKSDKSYPKSLIKRDIRDEVVKAMPIVAIFKAEGINAKKYTSITYINDKKLKVEELKKLPRAIKEKLDTIFLK